MLLNFEAEAKSLRPRSKGPETEAEVTRPRPRPRLKFWLRGFNISGAQLTVVNLGDDG